MEKRELYTYWDYEGTKYRIGKFDAMTGSYIAYKLMGEILPMGMKIEGIPSAPAGSKIMSKQDFKELQMECLKVCCAMLEAGPAAVMNDNGTWGVDGIENNAKIALVLTVQVLIHNLLDFFDESLLQALSTGMQSLFQLDAKM